MTLSFREKIELAKMLERLGLSVIEIPAIVNGKQDALLVKSLSSAIQSSTLAIPVDITVADGPDVTWEALREARRPRLQVAVPVSTVQMEYLCHKKPAALLQLVADTVGKCAALCPDVEFIAEDFNRSEPEFLAQAIAVAVGNGATTITVQDVAGNMLPEDLYRYVKELRGSIPAGVKLAVWCSNDIFMADSCAVAAIRAGVDEVKTTPGGVSTVSLRRLVHILNVKSDVFNATCGVNATEVQRGVSQIERLYESRREKQRVFRENTRDDRKDFELTVHDSREDVLKVASRLGYELSEEDANNVYDTFVRLASRNEVVQAKELDAIVASVAFQVPSVYRLESYLASSGNTITSTCHVIIRMRDEKKECVSLGDGPVDAAFRAIEEVLGRKFELDDFQIRSVTEGRDSMGEALVRLRYNGKIYSGIGISTDIIGSSISAYLNAVNKIVFEEEES